MERIFGIALGFVIWGLAWKLVMPRIRMAKDKAWGLSIAAGVLIALLFLASTLDILTNPLVLLVVPATYFAYVVNRMTYKVNELNKLNASKRPYDTKRERASNGKDHH